MILDFSSSGICLSGSIFSAAPLFLGDFFLSPAHSYEAPVWFHHLCLLSFSLTLSTLFPPLFLWPSIPLSLLYSLFWPPVPCCPLSPELMVLLSSWSRCQNEWSELTEDRGQVKKGKRKNRTENSQCRGWCPAKQPTDVTFCGVGFVAWSSHWKANPWYSEFTATRVKLCCLLATMETRKREHWELQQTIICWKYHSQVEMYS